LANSHAKAICGRPARYFHITYTIGHIDFIENRCWPCGEHILANTHSCCSPSRYLQLSLTGHSANTYRPLRNNLPADTQTTVFHTTVDWPHRSPLLAIAQTHIGQYEPIYRPTRCKFGKLFTLTGYWVLLYKTISTDLVGPHKYRRTILCLFNKGRYSPVD
jgi:hypothetical protein